MLWDICWTTLHHSQKKFRTYWCIKPSSYRCALLVVRRLQVINWILRFFKVMQKQYWYKPDTFLYKDLIIALARSKKMDEVSQLWESMRKENLFPDSQTYTKVIRGFLNYGSASDAMNIYKDLSHPLLKIKVKQDFEDIFPYSNSWTYHIFFMIIFLIQCWTRPMANLPHFVHDYFLKIATCMIFSKQHQHSHIF